MKYFDVCVQTTSTRVYKVHADDEEGAIEKACERAERRQDVDEAVGGSAQEAV